MHFLMYASKNNRYCLIELILPQGVIGLGLRVLINVDDDESINEQYWPDDLVMLPETK